MDAPPEKKEMNWIRYYISVAGWWIVMIALTFGTVVLMANNISLPGFICAGITAWWGWLGARE